MNDIIEFCENMGITESEYYGETDPYYSKKNNVFMWYNTHTRWIQLSENRFGDKGFSNFFIKNNRI